MRETEPITTGMHLGTVDASGSPIFYIFKAPCACVIKKISIVNSTAHAAHASDICTAAVTNLGTAGAGTTAVASQTTDSDVTGYAAITAHTPWNLILSTTAANLEMKTGEVLKLAVTEGGTATSGDLAAASVHIDYVTGSGIGQ